MFSDDTAGKGKELTFTLSRLVSMVHSAMVKLHHKRYFVLSVYSSGWSRRLLVGNETKSYRT